MKKLREITEDNDEDQEITVNTPLFIRLLEFAREDAKGDLILHFVAENAARLMKNNDCLDMSHYAELIKRKNS